MFDFFRLWLIVAGASIALGGLLLSLLGGTPALAWMNRLIDPAFGPGVADESARRFQAWIYGVLGAVMAGWGLAIAILVNGAFSTRQAWVWWAVALGAGLWFVLDTGQSLRYRVFANAAINTVLLVVLAIPLAFTFGEFH
ncbi:MAG: hypothetical protein ACXWM8_01470 [Candidatus Limnocylindrales bacterium]